MKRSCYRFRIILKGLLPSGFEGITVGLRSSASLSAHADARISTPMCQGGDVPSSRYWVGCRGHASLRPIYHPDFQPFHIMGYTKVLHVELLENCSCFFVPAATHRIASQVSLLCNFASLICRSSFTNFVRMWQRPPFQSASSVFGLRPVGQSF